MGPSHNLRASGDGRPLPPVGRPPLDVAGRLARRGTLMVLVAAFGILSFGAWAQPHFSPDVINQGLKIMDSTAITFCRDNKLPIVVFDVLKPGNIHRVLTGEQIGTLVD